MVLAFLLIEYFLLPSGSRNKKTVEMIHRSAEAILPAANDVAVRSPDSLALEGKKDLQRVEGYDAACP